MTFPIYEVEIGTCMTPGCKEQAGYGIFPNFCQPHADNLARIRDEMAQETEARRGRWASSKNGLRSTTRMPTCCTIGCDEPRKRSETYCAVCRAMGVEEDEAA